MKSIARQTDNVPNLRLPMPLLYAVQCAIQTCRVGMQQQRGVWLVQAPRCAQEVNYAKGKP